MQIITAIMRMQAAYDAAALVVLQLCNDEPAVHVHTYAIPVSQGLCETGG